MAAIAYVSALVGILLTFKWNNTSRHTIQFGFLYLASGLFAMGIYCAIHKTARKVLSWPSVEGEIIDSKSVRSSLLSFQTLVDYNYVISGKTYTTSNVFTGGIKSYLHGPKQSKDFAAQCVQNYRPGRKVTVYYNLLKPNESYLIGQLEPNLIMGIFGVLLLVYGIVVVLLNSK
jgi:hypothetical protein